MNLRPKFFVHMLIFTVAIVVLIQPAVLTALQNITPKTAYPEGSFVITIPPQAEQEDLVFCYQGQNTITVSVVFYNTPEGDASWMSNAVSQFSNAGITISISGYHYENETGASYYDYEYEDKLTDYMEDDNSMLVVSFTNLIPQPTDTYGHLAGYSRVQAGISVCFMGSLSDDDWAQYIITHEMAHDLGYFPEPNGHSSNPNSLMYPTFSGTNLQFDSTDISILENLH